MMCCGYATPAFIAFLMVCLVVSSDVYSIILIARNSHSAWRVIVCLIVFILTSAILVVVSWAFYQIIFTAPGFVPRETWQHPPMYVGSPPAQRADNHVQVRFPPTAGQPPNPNMQPPPPPPQQQQQQQLAPSMARRSPNNCSDLSQPRAYFTPLSVSQLPQQPPHALPQHPPSQPDCANPLQSGEETDARVTAGDACVETPVAAIVYTDSSDNSHRPLLQQIMPPYTGEEATKPEEEVKCSDVVAPVGVPAGSHSPYATPNHPYSIAPDATSGNHTTAAPSSSPSLNPYHVKTLNPNGTLRFCYTCRIYKPDGAHHCRVCERCIFNFDHHCPFVNNCVGRNNYKLFIVFLLYGGVGASLAGGLMAVTLFAVDRDEIMSKIGWIAVPAIDLVLGISLILFYIQHRVLLCNGESTLDSIARGDDTFQGWRRSLSRSRSTAAEKAEARRRKQAKVELHYRTLLGNESPWWRRYLPFPVRTDDRADDTVPGNV
jgi:hypothetical protein